jgi:hypothetical protein
VRGLSDRIPWLVPSCTALLLCACASTPPSPFFGDERFLVLGVQPDAEAGALAEQLERSGYRIERTLRGQHFTALFALDGDGRPAKVRVVTRRGVALALDAREGHAFSPGVRYVLLAPPLRDTHDADGDGFEEVFVEQHTAAEAPCILVYRVRDSGFADPVATSNYALPPGREPPWNAPTFCPDTASGSESESEPESESGSASESEPESEPTAPAPARSPTPP